MLTACTLHTRLVAARLTTWLYNSWCSTSSIAAVIPLRCTSSQLARTVDACDQHTRGATAHTMTRKSAQHARCEDKPVLNIFIVLVLVAIVVPSLRSIAVDNALQTEVYTTQQCASDSLSMYTSDAQRCTPVHCCRFNGHCH
eukprot:11315-Heterococcus_DN1.PRE.3